MACFLNTSFSLAQQRQDSISVYKKRVLESVEVDFLMSYYAQDGDNAAVTGGRGTEELTDVTSTVIISVPLSADEVLSVNAGISAYTSASSSNINPYDGREIDVFQASSGASGSDVWSSGSVSYSHSSEDRNQIWSGSASFATEYDYSSFGVGASFTQLWNEKNTELSASTHLYIDEWRAIYPTELRPFRAGGPGLGDPLFTEGVLVGNPNYTPIFQKFEDEGRSSFSLGLSFSQILHKNVQASLLIDVIYQEGLLSTPFQRVYFSDVADTEIAGFHLAEAIEMLPTTRWKTAVGSRLNWYLNSQVSLRTFLRYYGDSWGITSGTASIELPIKIGQYFTLYPSYRWYAQGQADYFNPYNMGISTDTYYTSDFDLSSYTAHQWGVGAAYTDVFTDTHIWKFGLKSIEVRYYGYDRNTTFTSGIVTAGVQFVLD